MDGSLVAEGRTAVELVDAATGAARNVPETIRADILALEAGASHYC